MNNISKALKEVWELKQACFEEIKDLPLKDAIKKRLNDSLENTIKSGFILQKGKKEAS